MSGRIRYTEEFKREAEAQVTERGHSVTSVAERIRRKTYKTTRQEARSDVFDYIELFYNPKTQAC